MRENMEAERGRKQLSKEALSRHLGITSRTYWNYIEGKPIPSDKLEAMSRLFGCSTDYLLGLTWDNVHRVDTVFSDYLGADDNIYTRAVARKSLVAAVARAIVGGVKYDYMPILAGPQGIGKSTLLATLGRQWFSDSLTTFEGKEAAEMLQGTWLNEIGELAAMSKYENAQVKQFLSKRSDIYRAAYSSEHRTTSSS